MLDNIREALAIHASRSAPLRDRFPVNKIEDARRPRRSLIVERALRHRRRASRGAKPKLALSMTCVLRLANSSRAIGSINAGKWSRSDFSVPS